MSDYTVYLRNAALERVAELDGFSQLTMNLRFNAVSNWELILSQTLTGYDLKKHGVVIYKDGQVLLSGPIRWIRQAYDGVNEITTIGGMDDMTWLAERIVMPDPNGPPYSTQSHDVRTGAAETVMRAYVNAHAAAGAKTARQVPYLSAGTTNGLGAAVTVRGRFDNLLTLLSEIAELGAVGDIGLGFRVVQSGTTLLFEVYEPTDRTDEVVFSVENGNLAGYTYEKRAPVSNYVYIGGQDELELRAIQETGDTASIAEWSRIETFKDQRNAETDEELYQWLIKEMRRQNSNNMLTTAPVELPNLAFGAQYELGDRVRVVMGDDVVEDLIREVQIILSGATETVTPVIGGVGYSTDDLLAETYRTINDLEERLTRLEAI